MALRPSIIKLGKNSLIFGVGNISTKFATFFLIPVYTKYLSLNEVGTLALIELLESFLSLLVLSGLIQPLWKRLGSSNEEEKSKIIFSAWIGLLISVSIISIIIISYTTEMEAFLGLNATIYDRLLNIVIFGIFCQVNGQFLLNQFQYDNKLIYYIFFSLIQLLLVLALSIYLTVFNGMGLHGIVYAKAIISALTFIYSTVYIVKNYVSFPSLMIFKQLISFGFPIILFALATPVLTLSDRFFLNLFVPLSVIGIYSINYKFGMLINMFLVVPLQRGLIPMIYKEGIKDEMMLIYKDILFYYFIAGCFSIIGITFFIRPVISFISSPDYLEAAYVVPFVASAYLISGFRLFFMPIIALKDRTDLLGKAAIIGITVCLGLNYFFIKEFGINGAVAVTVISYLIFTFSVYYLSNKISLMDWDWLRIVKVTLLTIFIISGVHVAKNQWDGLEWLLSILGFASFPVVLLAFRIIGEREINGVKIVLKKIIKVSK
jgi:O-antigen/teichoic acid export membrane protein